MTQIISPADVKAYHCTAVDVSESTEMYLLKTALLEEAGQYVPLPQLADELGVSPVSANEMCRKLQDQGLLTYQPYKGVALTAAGQEVAARVIRRRRLWEVFLVERLGLSVRDAEEAACRYEHVTDDEVLVQLAEYLGNPTACPHGQPIPPGPGGAAPKAAPRLSDLCAGDECRVVALRGDGPTRRFLLDRGIAPGAVLGVRAVASGGPVLVRTAETSVSLSHDVSASIEIERNEP